MVVRHNLAKRLYISVLVFIPILHIVAIQNSDKFIGLRIYDKKCSDLLHVQKQQRYYFCILHANYVP